MEAIIFTGLQASGKSTFFQQRFFNTHVRINLDMLRSRNREKQLMQVCIQTQQPFVVDNTNPTREDRHKYIEAAKAAGAVSVGVASGHYSTDELAAAGPDYVLSSLEEPFPGID